MFGLTHHHSSRRLHIFCLIHLLKPLIGAYGEWSFDSRIRSIDMLYLLLMSSILPSIFRREILGGDRKWNTCNSVSRSILPECVVPLEKQEHRSWCNGSSRSHLYRVIFHGTNIDLLSHSNQKVFLYFEIYIISFSRRLLQVWNRTLTQLKRRKHTYCYNNAFGFNNA